MHPAEQRRILQQFVSADQDTLVKELEPHQVEVGLALRRSPFVALAKGAPEDWVSALQEHADKFDSVDKMATRKSTCKVADDDGGCDNWQTLRQKTDNIHRRRRGTTLG